MDIKHQKMLCAGILFIVSIIIFSQSVTNNFVWDTRAVLNHEPRIESFATSLRFFTEPYIFANEDLPSLTTRGINKYYRPLVGILHTLEIKIFGLNPAPFKAVNLFLNGTVTVLAFFFLLQLSGNLMLSFLSALLFACNPTRAEVVYWVYSDSYMLVAIFLLLSLMAYVREKNILSIVLFTCALFVQENAILLPAIIGSYHVLIRQDGFKKMLLAVSPYAAISAIYLGIRSAAVGKVGINTFSFPEVLNSAVFLVQKHLKLYFLTDAPVPFYYANSRNFSHPDLENVLAYITCAALIALAIYLWKRNRYLLFWLSWFAIWMSIHIILGGQTYLMSEKVLYLPSLGISVLVVAMANTFFRKEHIVIGLIILFSTLHAVDAYNRAPYWKDTKTYLQQAITFEPKAGFLYYQLGTEHLRQSEYDNAEEVYRRLNAQTGVDRQAHGYYVAGMAETYFARGNHLFNAKQFENAIVYFRKALKFNPKQPAVLFSLGNALLETNRVDEAIVVYEKAAELLPGFRNIYYNLALAYKKKKNVALSELYYKKYIALKKTN